MTIFALANKIKEISLKTLNIMRSLATFKGIATRLKKQVANAKALVAECEYKFNGNPCKLTISALDKAEHKLGELEAKLENANEMVEHYDFYAFCYEQEQEEAAAREVYLCR